MHDCKSSIYYSKYKVTNTNNFRVYFKLVCYRCKLQDCKVSFKLYFLIILNYVKLHFPIILNYIFSEKGKQNRWKITAIVACKCPIKRRRQAAFFNLPIKYFPDKRGQDLRHGKLTSRVFQRLETESWNFSMILYSL